MGPLLRARGPGALKICDLWHPALRESLGAMLRILWAFLLLATGLEASITAAWKVPVEHFAPDYKTNGKVRKLEKPPGESKFFEGGDELWDVSKLLWKAELRDQDPFEEKAPQAKLPWVGEWAVWNSRSGMLVARGRYFELLEAQRACGFDDLPRLSLARFELKQGAIGTVLPILSRSGERTSTPINGVKIDLDLLRGPTPSHDLRCAVSWKDPGTEATWNVASSFFVRNEAEVLVAKYGSGDGGWELRAAVSYQSIGGVPLAEARLIEIGGKAPQPWAEVSRGLPLFERQSLGDGLSIAVYQAPPSFGTFLASADLKVPERLWGWIRGSFHDVGKGMANFGVDSTAPGFFAGLETRTDQLVLVGSDATHDSVSGTLESIFASSPSDVLLVETDRPSGNWGLLVCDGHKAVISLTEGDGNKAREVKAFEIEPVLEEARTSVKLGCTGNFDAGATKPLAGTATMKMGEWTEWKKPREKQAAGEMTKLRVTLNPP